MSATCLICETRRPRRRCPALQADICAPCCGEKREETIACPLDCDFLLQARNLEQLRELKAEEIPHPDIVVKEEFLREQEPLVYLVGYSITEGVHRLEGLIDLDIREALAGLVQTYKSLSSGIVYESKPANPIAAAMFELIQLRLSEFRSGIEREAGYAVVLDSHVLGVLVFFLRMELQFNNGRRRSRGFIDAALRMAPPQPPPQQQEPPPSSLIL